MEHLTINESTHICAIFMEKFYPNVTIVVENGKKYLFDGKNQKCILILDRYCNGYWNVEFYDELSRYASISLGHYRMFLRQYVKKTTGIVVGDWKKKKIDVDLFKKLVN